MNTIEQKIAAFQKRAGRVNPTVESIQAAACVAFDVSLYEFRSTSRHRRTTRARQASMATCRRKTKLTLTEIGLAHNRDHGTVMHANQVFDAYIQSDTRFRDGVAMMERLLKEETI